MHPKLFYLFVLPLSVILSSLAIQYFFGSSVNVVRAVVSGVVLFLFGLYFTRKKGEHLNER